MNEKIILINRKEVERQTSLSRSKIYELMDKKLFPQQIQISKMHVVWNEHDIQNWIKDIIKKGTENDN